MKCIEQPEDLHHNISDRNPKVMSSQKEQSTALSVAILSVAIEDRNDVLVREEGEFWNPLEIHSRKRETGTGTNFSLEDETERSECMEATRNRCSVFSQGREKTRRMIPVFGCMWRLSWGGSGGQMFRLMEIMHCHTLFCHRSCWKSNENAACVSNTHSLHKSLCVCRWGY